MTKLQNYVQYLEDMGTRDDELVDIEVQTLASTTKITILFKDLKEGIKR